MFSLSYLTSAERLTVVVLKARNFHFLEESKQTATASKYRPLSRRLDRCDRVIQHETCDSNGGNV